MPTERLAKVLPTKKLIPASFLETTLNVGEQYVEPSQRPCNRLSTALKSFMATLRQQIATNVLTVTRFRELMKKLRENRPNDDLDIVKRAYDFSQKHHAGQSRASGEPYLVHPLEVGNVLADMKMDAVSIAAGTAARLRGRYIGHHC